MTLRRESPGKRQPPARSAPHGATSTTNRDGARAGDVPLRALDPAATSPSAVATLQRLAGNRAVATSVQRGGNGPTATTPRPALDPGLEETHDNLESFCDRGGDVAWDLYRAILQLEADAANEKYGRMSTDANIAATVVEARTSHQRAMDTFARIRGEGSTAWSKIQKQATGPNPDLLAVNDELLRLVEQTDAAAALIATIANRAWDLAVRAEESGHLVAARHAFRAADEAESVRGERRPRIPIRTGQTPVNVPGKLYEVGVDALANTVGGGVYGNIVSGVAVNASQGSALANFATGTGGVFGPLAVLCSSIDLVLGIVGAVKSQHRLEQLEKLQSQLSDPRAREAARYAAEQKGKKRTQRWITVGAATAGLAAGIAGCVALGVTTFGVGALAIGVIAAVIGLSILAYKWYRKSKYGQRRKMKQFAQSIIETASDPDADPADRELARERIAQLGVDVPQRTVDGTQVPDFRQTPTKDLAQKLSEQGMSRRQETAQGLLDLLVNGRRSERRDAELVLSGLKLKPDKLREQAETGSGNAAVESIAGKLASW